jgi:hypothetical protein
MKPTSRPNGEAASCGMRWVASWDFECSVPDHSGGTAWEQNGSKNHEGVSELIANPSDFLVAGAGFEPATFGL